MIRPHDGATLREVHRDLGAGSSGRHRSRGWMSKQAISRKTVTTRHSDPWAETACPACDLSCSTAHQIWETDRRARRSGRCGRSASVTGARVLAKQREAGEWMGFVRVGAPVEAQCDHIVQTFEYEPLAGHVGRDRDVRRARRADLAHRAIGVPVGRGPRRDDPEPDGEGPGRDTRPVRGAARRASQRGPKLTHRLEERRDVSAEEVLFDERLFR